MPRRAAGLDAKGILEQMGHAYARLLLADPYVLRLQLHAYAACDDPEVRAVVATNSWRSGNASPTSRASEPTALHGGSPRGC